MEIIKKQIIGTCSDCNEVVLAGEPLYRISKGQYVCEPCYASTCVRCGSKEALYESDDDEPLCRSCRDEREQRSARREAEANAKWAENMRPLFEGDDDVPSK